MALHAADTRPRPRRSPHQCLTDRDLSGCTQAARALVSSGPRRRRPGHVLVLSGASCATGGIVAQAPLQPGLPAPRPLLPLADMRSSEFPFHEIDRPVSERSAFPSGSTPTTRCSLLAEGNRQRIIAFAVCAENVGWSLSPVLKIWCKSCERVLKFWSGSAFGQPGPNR